MMGAFPAVVRVAENALNPRTFEVVSAHANKGDHLCACGCTARDGGVLARCERHARHGTTGACVLRA